jgi:NADH-quinone oxidoreductase subunit K
MDLLSYLPQGLVEITLSHYITLSSILFLIGVTGVIMRRNILIIYMGLELMLNAANLALIAFNRFAPTPVLDGQILVFFIITVAAAEVAVGLALIVALYRVRSTTNVLDLKEMKF